MKIRISCTSYLPPRNPAWKSIETDHELVFGEFGDWPQVLTAPAEEDALLWAFFTEDLLPKELLFSQNTADIDSAKSIIDAAIEALQFRLNSDPGKYTFIAWLGWQPDSVLRSSRQKPLYKVVSNYFEERLFVLMETHKRLFVIPLDQVFGEEGYKKCTDSRNFFLSRIRLSQSGLKLLVSSLDVVLQRIKKPSAKLLVLDCDNTLWGGVIGENGLSGILIGQDGLGSAFTAFQQGVKQLSKNGLLLAISSKNEEKDVMNVFENHGSMILKKEDIILSKVDWRDKSSHIQEIAAEIGIGLDSIVFWDDNPIEREKVKQSLPQVMVIDPPLEVVEWYDTLKSLHCFASFSQSKEDLNKVSQYKAKAAFETETKQFSNYNDFLSNIDMVPALIEIDAGTISRAVQLCQKTNQMNLRLARHDEVSLQQILDQPDSVSFLVHLKDKFGDHGIIALVIAKPSGKNGVAFLDTFLMSCRVLGRNIEGWIFDNLRSRLLEKGFSELEGEYIYGERNSPAINLLPDYGFVHIQTTSNGNTNKEEYRVALTAWKLANLEIFNTKHS
jgi:FkbH-like protein